MLLNIREIPRLHNTVYNSDDSGNTMGTRVCQCVFEVGGCSFWSVTLALQQKEVSLTKRKGIQLCMLHIPDTTLL